MKTITKHFDTMAKAEAYQNRLYNKYETVRLIRSPMFSEAGIYEWRVA
jgi:hypothetical protein